MSVIKVEGLRKTYRGGVAAIDNLSLDINVPGVHGFLGPNGAGKTTTIRCLLGLIKPSAGRVSIFGTDTSKSFSKVCDRVGALVETPKFSPDLSGRKNLALLARLGGVASSGIDHCIDTVGLTERAGHKYKTYSLGMKQRLAIAATLLKDPDLIVLDEPANGLDPAGIVEIRQLIRQLGESGKTVFVSSHQLGEVEQTCDYVTIISKGRTVAAGSVADIINSSAPAEQLVTFYDDVRPAISLLSANNFQVRQTGHNELAVAAGVEYAGEIVRVLSSAQIYLQSLRPAETSLESIFLDLTENGGELTNV